MKKGKPDLAPLLGLHPAETESSRVLMRLTQRNGRDASIERENDCKRIVDVSGCGDTQDQQFRDNLNQILDKDTSNSVEKLNGSFDEEIYDLAQPNATVSDTD